MILIFESHPIQYRAPLYRELHKLKPHSFLVVYASDCSIRGREDIEFGVQVKWDEPLLSGYPNRVLNNERGVPLSGFFSLHSKGILDLLLEVKPSAILLTQFAYEFEFSAYLSGKILGIPIWIRMETQDEAFERSWIKSAVRSLIYSALYLGISKVFYFGVLNRGHLIRHGVDPAIMHRTPYCVVDRWSGYDSAVAAQRECSWRRARGVPMDAWVIGFFGKFIEKKDPLLLMTACSLLPSYLKKRLHLVMVGAGELHQALQVRARDLGLSVHFTGFVNQLAIADCYLGVDLVVLPSRRMGEVWGLVVNEALHAGCSVAISDAVGCYPEFKDWERVKVFPSGDAVACMHSLASLSNYRRDIDWCRKRMIDYSIEVVAKNISAQIQ